MKDLHRLEDSDFKDNLEVLDPPHKAGEQTYFETTEQPLKSENLSELGDYWPEDEDQCFDESFDYPVDEDDEDYDDFDADDFYQHHSWQRTPSRKRRNRW